MQGGRYLRTLLLLLAIGCTLVVSTAAASPVHWHQKQVSGGCEICTIAHLPVVQPPVSVDLHPPALADWHVCSWTERRVVESCRRIVAARGPPSLSFVLVG